MRLLLIVERYAPEARSHAHIFQDLAEGLARRGHDVVVIAKMPVDYIPEDSSGKNILLPADTIENGVHVVRIRELFGPRKSILLRAIDQVFFGFCVIWKALWLKKCDRIIVYSPPLPLAGIVGIYARTQAIPLILNLHDLYPRTSIELGVLKNTLLIWAAQKLEETVYGLASHFLVPSPGSYHYLVDSKKLEGTRVHLIFNWVDTDEVKPGIKDGEFRRAHNLNGHFVISYAGNMGYAQDLSSIIACASRMAEDPDIIFCLGGEGVYRQRWEQEAKGLKNIHFLPNLERHAYLDLLRASDVCLVPLTAELHSPAIPGKIQNIMAVARPIVAIVPEDSEAARVIHQSHAGFVVIPGDEDELKRVLSVLRSDHSLCESQGNSGRNFAEEHFDLEKALSRIEKVLKASDEFCEPISVVRN